jgi:hypothetical protein
MATQLYDFTAARDGDVVRASFLADGQLAAEHIALEMGGDAFREKSWKSYEEMAGDTDGCTLEVATTVAVPLPVRAAYRELLRGLTEMVENGRLTDGSIPDDFRWLSVQLEELADLGERGDGEEE